ncbi:transposase [Streptomyces canus]|uniref:transposase n=1 Tax=Streptomyces canus TaxID=58343 RepID=UPI003AF38E9C
MYRTAESKAVIRRMAEELGVHHEALRNWIRQAEADDCRAHGRAASSSGPPCRSRRSAEARRLRTRRARGPSRPLPPRRRLCRRSVCGSTRFSQRRPSPNRCRSASLAANANGAFRTEQEGPQEEIFLPSSPLTIR